MGLQTFSFQRICVGYEQRAHSMYTRFATGAPVAFYQRIKIQTPTTTALNAYAFIDLQQLYYITTA